VAKKILIVGAGFAGLWSALGAARLLDKTRQADGSIEIELIAPSPFLHLRPRFHEVAPSGMETPLLPLLEAVGVRYIQGWVDRIRTDEKSVNAIDADGNQFTLQYDKLVLASGSKLYRPDLPGLHEYAHSIDQLTEACALDSHIASLSALPDSPARNTVIVVGGGFTGIEIATGLPARLRAAWGENTDINVIIIEQAENIGPELGAGPRPVIEQALRELGITWRLNTAATAIDAEGLTTSAGEHIDAKTVIWTAGMLASSLTEQIDAPRDRIGRLHVTADLKVSGVDDIFATGDVALALTDDSGHYALMSCQHALMMGRFAGHNVAADLIGLPTIPYRQPQYGTCLDLGGWGAVYTEGWTRDVKLTGAAAKALKQMINTKLIYPPLPDRAAALEAADLETKLVT
jgi:NADH:ubiquinone reductase (H+-translocating)